MAFHALSPAGVRRIGLLCVLLALSPAALAAQTITYTDGETNATAYDSTDRTCTLTIARGSATQSGNFTGDGTLTLTGTNYFEGDFTITAAVKKRIRPWGLWSIGVWIAGAHWAGGDALPPAFSAVDPKPQGLTRLDRLAAAA